MKKKYQGFFKKIIFGKDVHEAVTIFNNNPDPVIKADGDGTITLCNPAARELFFQDIRGKSIYSILPVLKENVFSELNVAGIARFHTTISERDFTFLVKKQKEENITLLYGNDITYRREIEEELRRLKVAVEQSANAIIITDPDGKIVFANKAFEKTTGYTIEEVLGKNPRILKSEYHSKEYYRELWDTIKGGEIWHGEFLNRKKDGSSFWEEAVITPILDDSGRLRNFIAVKEDITARKKAEKELVNAKKEAERANRMKSEFLANMSHEIRTPMNAILGFTDILLEESGNPDVIEKLEIIKQSGKSLMNLLNDILDFSKIEAGKIDLVDSPFAIQRSLEHLYNIFEHEAVSKGLTFTVEIDSELPNYVGGDEFRLRQILTNLLSNAIKFTDQGEIVLDAKYSEGALIISVTDTGIGISQEKVKKIFSAFEQGDTSTEKKYGGTGLGLAISMRLADLMGGTLDVRSVEGKGSTFFLTLPFTPVKEGENSEEKGVERGEESSVTQSQEERGQGEQAQDIRLLVAEDNKLNQKLICTLVKNLNLSCDIAENGREALNKLKEKKYHLLLLDMEMPVMDGIETIEHIRAEEDLNNLYVIALTAHALQGDEEKYIRYGCNDYLAKPLDRSVFEGKIKEQISKLHPSISRDIGNTSSGGGELEKITSVIQELKENSTIFNPEKIIAAAEKIQQNSEYRGYHWYAERLIQAASQFDDVEVRDIIREMEKN